MILSLFSGVGMLDEAFRELGECVVSAGDVLWGSLYDVRRFHTPAGTSSPTRPSRQTASSRRLRMGCRCRWAALSLKQP